VPAGTFALNQLMLGHLDRRRRQIEDLAALHPGDRAARPPAPAPAAAGRLMAYLPVRPGRLHQGLPVVPILPARLTPGLLPQRPRRRLPSPSLEAGFGEFRESCFSCASSSAIRNRARSSSARVCVSS